MREEDAGKRVEMPGDSSGVRGRHPQGTVEVASSPTARRARSCQETTHLMEVVVERENMVKALGQVEGNKGSAGVDGVSVHDLRA